jgi:hypothetical protein
MKGTLKNSLSSSILVHKAIGRNYILLLWVSRYVQKVANKCWKGCKMTVAEAEWYCRKSVMHREYVTWNLINI